MNGTRQNPCPSPLFLDAEAGGRYTHNNSSARLIALSALSVGWIFMQDARELAMPTRQLKHAATVGEQIATLRARGMQINDAFATQWLNSVSYYRLSAYWYPARQTDPDGTRLDYFRPKTRFEDVALLYEADRKLRTLIHDGVERIEVALRTQLINVVCLPGDRDALSYTNPESFRPTFKHADWLATINRRIARAERRNRAIQHYRSHYESQFPLWVAAETMDFSDASRLFQGLKSADQFTVSEALGIKIDLSRLIKNQSRQAKKKHPLTSWFEQLSVIRNTCAHHGRLWNKSFVPAPTPALISTGHFTYLPSGQSEQVFGALAVMAHLLRHISPGTTWPNKVVDLLNNAFITNPLVNPESLGIPNDWDMESI